MCSTQHCLNFVITYVQRAAKIQFKSLFVSMITEQEINALDEVGN
jgi:hypothetical protein